MICFFGTSIGILAILLFIWGCVKYFVLDLIFAEWIRNWIYSSDIERFEIKNIKYKYTEHTSSHTEESSGYTFECDISNKGRDTTIYNVDLVFMGYISNFLTDQEGTLSWNFSFEGQSIKDLIIPRGHTKHVVLLVGKNNNKSFFHEQCLKACKEKDVNIIIKSGTIHTHKLAAKDKNVLLRALSF